MKFTQVDYFRLIQSLESLNLPIVPLEDCYSPDHMNVISVRHDVDDNLQASVDMATMECNLGIISTYFILNTAPYWNAQNLRLFIPLLTRNGHYIGWHNNALTEHLKTGKSLADCIYDPVNALNRFAKVTGTASHGDPLCYDKRYLNYNVFSESKIKAGFMYAPDDQFELSQFGLKYEAYHTGYTHYISDSGGEWKQDNAEVLRDIRAYMDRGEPVKLQVLIHPQWWSL